MAIKNDIQYVADSINSEITGDARAISSQIGYEIVRNGDTMSRPDFLALVERNWNDPHFREVLRQSQGDQAFLQIGKELQKRQMNPSQDPVQRAALAAQSPFPTAMPPPTPPIMPPGPGSYNVPSGLPPGPSVPLPPGPGAPMPPGGLPPMPPGPPPAGPGQLPPAIIAQMLQNPGSVPGAPPMGG